MSDTVQAGVAVVDSVSKIYAGGGHSEVHALRSVSLAISTGEMLAVMGASGSGKSTLLNILGTLDRPTSGRYVLAGQAIDHLDDRALSRLRSRNIGFIFQSFHLLARETAFRNVELPMIYAQVPVALRRRRALLALKRVGLTDRADHFPSQLSGGQQQRVSIARALVNNPRLVLADEPTGSLDSVSARQIMETFVSLNADGVTIVLVTHDPEVARYAQRVVTFHDGRVVSDVRSRALPS